MGYGFLIFSSKEDAENSLDILTGKIMPKANKFFKLNHAVFNNRKNTSIIVEKTSEDYLNVNN